MSGILQTFWISLSATLKAATLASTGIYFHRAGFVATPQVLARYFQQIGLPCLFFAKIVLSRSQNRKDDSAETTQDSNLVVSVLLCGWPIYVVTCGLLIGHVLGYCAGLPAGQRRVLLAAISIGNSTSLPMILLSMMTASDEKMAAAAEQVLSSYFVLYPLLQWGVGGALLGLGEVPPQKYDVHKQNVTLTRSSSSSTMSLSSRSDEGEVDLESSGKESCIATAAINSAEDASTKSNRRVKTNIRSQLNTFYAAFRRGVRQPPVIGALLGSAVISFPVLHRSLADGSLQWLGQAVSAVGDAAVPVSMAVLGVNLSIALSSSNRKSKESINRDLVIAGLTGKLLLMPLMGLMTVRILHFYLDLDSGMAMAMGLLFCMPTANAVMVMADLSQILDEKTQMGLARMLALQYLVAPVFLPLWVMRTMQIAQSGSARL